MADPFLFQIVWSAVAVAASVLIQTAGLNLIAMVLVRRKAGQAHDERPRQTTTMGLVVYLLFVLHLLQITAYAVIYVATGAVETFQRALYFSAATFTTIGGGEVRTEEAWQLFAALEGLAGIILIGWSVSFLVAVSHWIGLRDQQR